MAQQREELKNPGDVILEKIELESITGERFNLMDVMIEINIYEDLFSNGVTGDIMIVDSVNLFNLVPLIGQEKFILKFKTPVVDPDNIRELTFQVYKISQRVLKNDRTQGYVLHFASIPTIRNSLVKIKRTLGPSTGNNNITDMVSDIVLDELDAELFNAKATIGSPQYVIPSWSPFKTINWLAKRAVTKDGDDANFVFFETINSDDIQAKNGMTFHFISIGELMKQESRHLTRYNFGPVSRTLKQTGKEIYTDINAIYYIINDYEILDAMDTLNAINSGMFASNLITYDITTKKIENTTFDYLEFFGKSTVGHLEGKSKDSRNPLTVEKENPAGFKYHDFPDSSIQRFDKQKSKQSGQDSNPEDYLLQRQSSLQQLKMHRMRCVVPGNSFLRAGDVFDMFLPSPEKQQTQAQEDTYISGKYIVTSLRHKIQKNNYFSIMELAKDSFFNPINETTKNQ